MKVALYGATGQSGSRILKELVSRGHELVDELEQPKHRRQRFSIGY